MCYNSKICQNVPCEKKEEVSEGYQSHYRFAKIWKMLFGQKN